MGAVAMDHVDPPSNLQPVVVRSSAAPVTHARSGAAPAAQVQQCSELASVASAAHPSDCALRVTAPLAEKEGPECSASDCCGAHTAAEVFPHPGVGELLPDGSVCDSEAAGMLDFAHRAVSNPPPVRASATLDPSVVRAIEWVAMRSCADIISERERIVAEIEAEGAALARDGSVAAWAAPCDAVTQRVVEHVNGPLLQRLAERSGFWDLDAVNMLRDGAPLVGPLPASGNGAILAEQQQPDVTALWQGLAEHNKMVLERLRDDEWGDDLLAQVAPRAQPALRPCASARRRGRRQNAPGGSPRQSSRQSWT